MKYEKQAYESLLDKVDQVFAEEFSQQTLSATQKVVINGLLHDRIEDRNGDPSKVTLAEVRGVRELLYQEFNLAAVLDGSDK